MLLFHSAPFNYSIICTFTFHTFQRTQTNMGIGIEDLHVPSHLFYFSASPPMPLHAHQPRAMQKVIRPSRV